MTPNAARLLRKYGVDKAIGENLVRFEELNLRRRDGTKVGYATIDRIEKSLHQPWWLVHRHHLHAGLVKIASEKGCRLMTNSRVAKLQYQNSESVIATTESGKEYTFDLLIGADGVGSIVRRTLFPDVKPTPPSTNCAYRAIVPYDKIRQHPELRELVQKPTMEVWMGPDAYIISYPISAGKDFNMVLSHHRREQVWAVEDIDIDEFKNDFKDFDPKIRTIVGMIESVQRWPLLATGPLTSWSSPQKNMVLMGDAAHSMVNHMAQGAATSMEDGEFLGMTLRHVVQGDISVKKAVEIYEKARMPLADIKQQVSFLNGAIWMLPDGPEQEARDKALEPELRGEPYIRSPNLYSDPRTVLECYGYDAEAHAEAEVQKYLHARREVRDAQGMTKRKKDDVMGWFLPGGPKGPSISARL